MTDVRAERRYTAGRTLLGPVVLKYLTLLRAYLWFREPETSRLYVARAGVRIKEMFERYAESGGSTVPDGQVLWVSRLLVAKGVFADAPAVVGNLFSQEFQGQTVADVLRGLWRHEPEWLLRIGDEWPGLGAAESFAEFVLTGQSRQARAARQYFHEYRSMYRQYIDRVAGEKKRIVLIDSGWQGTIHRLMAEGDSTTEFQSLLFARVLRESEPRAHANDVTGLMVETDSYVPGQPESAFVLHRHLVESLFEIDLPSAETLHRSPAGRVESPLEGQDVPESTDVLVLGVFDYIVEHADQGLVEIFGAASEAMTELGRMILTPDPSAVPTLTVPPRTADFGRELTVPVVLDAVDRFEGDSPTKRIEDALWQPGQIALEYQGAAATAATREFVEAVGARSYFTAGTSRRLGDITTQFEPTETPVVAIVTRTKDRPVLLRRAASSIADQTFANYRWIVVNDGGMTESVVEVLEHSGVEQDKITLVNNEESVGMEAASNLGVGASESDFVVIHDDDDSWDPHFLEQTVAFLNSHDGLNYGGVATQSVYVSEEILGDHVVIHDQRPHDPGLHVVKLSKMAEENLFPPIAFLFRRSVYEKLGGFDRHLPVLGDWDFNLRFLALVDIGVLPLPLAYYHHRDVGASGTYGNSVVAARDIYEEYEAIVRNRMARSLSDDTVAVMSALGDLSRMLQNELWRVGNPTTRGGDGATDQRAADDYWIALTAIAHSGRIVNHSSRIARYANGILRRGFRVKTGLVVEDMDEFVRELLSSIDPKDIPVPPHFAEQGYLDNNPDVRDAVGVGDFRSGYHHYLTHGRSEGRPRPMLGA